MKKGKLIVLDGTDGSGKATQAKILLQRLKHEGYKVAYIDFPQYGQYSALFVEKYLRGEFGTAKEVGPYRASLFYALDRYAAKQKLERWLKEGRIIIANRYVSSNQIHQAGKIKDKKELQRYLRWLDDLEFVKLGIPRPDVVLFLNVPPSIGQQLVDKKKQRSYLSKGTKRDIHEADMQHLLDSYHRACSLVKKYAYWKDIPCTNTKGILPIDVIARKIWGAISDLL
jgi:dTMP kinase